MSDCQIDAVDALFRGELDEAEAKRVSAHIAVCPECSAELRWLERERRFFQPRKDTYPAPPSLAEVLKATRAPSLPRKIAQSKRAAPKRTRWMVFGFGLAAAFLIGAILFFAASSPSPEVAADPPPASAHAPYPVFPISPSPNNECFACSPASEHNDPLLDAGPDSEDCDENTSSGVTFPVCGPRKK